MAKARFDATTTEAAHLTDLTPVVADAIVSTPIVDVPGMKLIMFAMDAGQSISQHRAPFVATVHVLDGGVRFGVNDRIHDLGPNDWLVMPPNEPHDVVAKTPTRFLLTLVKP